jgi:hypothetical protein
MTDSSSSPVERSMIFSSPPCSLTKRLYRPALPLTSRTPWRNNVLHLASRTKSRRLAMRRSIKGLEGRKAKPEHGIICLTLRLVLLGILSFPLDVHQQCDIFQYDPEHCVFACGAVIGYRKCYHRPLESYRACRGRNPNAPSKSSMVYLQQRRRYRLRLHPIFAGPTFWSQLMINTAPNQPRGPALSQGSFTHLIGHSAFLVQRNRTHMRAIEVLIGCSHENVAFRRFAVPTSQDSPVMGGWYTKRILSPPGNPVSQHSAIPASPL